MKHFIVVILLLLITITSFSQNDSETVTLTVSGTGETLEKARFSALRSAIEQSFGTFISSNTKVLNDELAKDEIVSISNGNIQDYKIISEVKTPQGYWATTLKATVALGKLVSFCKSKGISAEFKGNLFSMNIKQQILNEENEVTVIENMCKVLDEIKERSCNYEIEVVGDPISKDNENKNWEIPIKVNVIANDNFKIIPSYLIKTLKGISLSELEVENYRNMKKDVYAIAIAPLIHPEMQKNEKKPIVVYLRKRETVINLINFIIDFANLTRNIKVTNGVEQFDADEECISVNDWNFRPFVLSSHWKDEQRYHKTYSSIFTLRYITQSRLVGSNGGLYIPGNSHISFSNHKVALKGNSLNPGYPRFYKLLLESNSSYFDLIINFSDINNKKPLFVLSINDEITLEELEKITEYKILKK